MALENTSDRSDVTPLEAAQVLAAIEGDEAAIIEAFRNLTQRERDKIGSTLSSFASVLYMESKFQPVLLEEPVKIPVTSFEEGIAVQEALFRLGCGFHHGGYPLAKTLSDQCSLSGVFVSRKGVMTIMPNSSEKDRDYVANHESRAVSPASVLTAVSLADLLK